MTIARGILTTTSQLAVAGLLAATVTLGACGGNNGNSGGPASGNGGNQPPPTEGHPGGSPDETAAAIDELLGDMSGGGEQAQGGPPPTGSPAQGSTGDDFLDGINRVKGKVPGWDSGTGVVIKFLKEATGSRLSLIYVDTTAPEYKSQVGLWLIHTKAHADNKVLGHFMLMLKNLSPGTYRGSPSSKDVIMATQIGERWNGKAPDATWSINNQSWCEITLRPGRASGDLEGSFRAKLVDNSGQSYHTIENGYIYINR